MTGEVIVSKLANALVEDAEVDGTVAEVGPAIGAPLERSRQKYGGIWVGGRVTLTTESLAFGANALNRALQTGTLDSAIPLTSIVGVEELGGFVSQKVRVTYAGGSFTFRCFGAKRVARQIRDAVAAAGSV